MTVVSGLRVVSFAGTCRAVLCGIGWRALPDQAARAALAVAAIAAADEPAATTRLRKAIGRGSGPRPVAPPPGPESDVIAEVESLEKDWIHLGGLPSMFDPDLVPKGLSGSGSRLTRACR